MKRAIVTGAGSGIGKEIAKKFLLEGYQTICLYNSSESGIEDLQKWSYDNKVEGAVYPYKVDLENASMIKSVYTEINQKFKSIDVLVNNAGVSLTKLITDTSVEEWEHVFGVNVKGAFVLTNLVLESMITAKRGKIINVSSMWGLHGASMEVAYSASKSALIGYTKALAKEVGPCNITVNCVCPGVIDTKMNKHLTNEDINSLIEDTPLCRIGSVEDVANLVEFLASSKADFITGECITVDGGYSL